MCANTVCQNKYQFTLSQKNPEISDLINRKSIKVPAQIQNYDYKSRGSGQIV